MALSTKQIQARAIELLLASPAGLTFGELTSTIRRESPDTNVRTVNTQVSQLPVQYPDLVRRPERGLFVINPDSSELALFKQHLAVHTVRPGAGRRKAVQPPPLPGEVPSKPRPSNSSQAKPSLPATTATLKSVGFHQAGYWHTPFDRLEHRLILPGQTHDVLYAFVVGDQVMYLGKTKKSLKGRMTMYANPGKDKRQSTNIRANERIRECISCGKVVEIWLLDSWEPLSHCGIPVSVPAGIEDELIALMRPLWNVRSAG